MTFRYNKAAQDFDADLSDLLQENEGERIIKEAVDKEPDDALKRIVTARTPLDEVREIVESKTKKSAAEVLEEHSVRLELRKLAARSRENVDAFLAAEDG